MTKDGCVEDRIWEQTEVVLSKIFCLPGFREGQEDIVRSVLSGHDTLAVMPTGSGKSLCYQLPGYILPGLTLVISPLIALMKDQVDSLITKGIPAANLHSGLDLEEQRSIYESVRLGRIKFLFVAPERVRNGSFQFLITQVKIGLLAVDEAHCISQWGHDFRPDYRRLGALRQVLGNPVTIALTATASPEVQRDIVQQLMLTNPGVFILGFDRMNLRFGVRTFRTEREKLTFALSFVKQRIQQRCGFKRQYPGGGILYASTIKQAEATAAFLKEHGIRAGLYHAGLQPAVRTQVQEQFMNDEFHCLVATTAFGMGVDKPDIRYVLHLSMSSSVEAYTQESGRAGRDRLPSECMLLYAPADVKIQEHFIDNGCPDLTIYRTIFDAFAEASHTPNPVSGTHLMMDELLDRFENKNHGKVDTALRKLRSRDVIRISPNGSMTWLATVTDNLIRALDKESQIQKKVSKSQLKSLVNYVYEENCRTKFILNYFGSRDSARFSRCHHCDLCRAMPICPDPGTPGPFPPEPTLFIILKILSTVARCQIANLPLTPRQITSILIGSTGEPSLTKITTFGLLDYMDGAEIMVISGMMRETGLIDISSGFAFLTSAGKKALSAKAPSQLPKVLQYYLDHRFPNAESSGPPYHPGKT